MQNILKLFSLFSKLNKKEKNSQIKMTTMQLGTYLFYRLSQVTKSVFGVPGDFNLNLLEHIYNFEESQIKWCGNANELNAGYAADGYSRINKFGCFITTYGVGELSALNAISGAFAENAPVLQIVGTSSMLAKRRACPLNQIHHLIPSKQTYGAPDHRVYEKLVEPFSIHTESLSDENLEKIQDQIDSVIQSIFCHMKPGYLFIPSNLPDIEIPVDLNKQLKFDFITELNVDQRATSEMVSLTLERIYSSKNPGFIVDQFMKFDLEKLNLFLEESNFYCYNTISSRGFADESLPNFHGVFNNELSTNGTLEILDENDFILQLGTNINESSYYAGGNIPLSKKDVIFIGKDYAQVGTNGRIIPGVNCHVFFEELLQRMNSEAMPKVKTRKSTALYNKGYTVGDDSTELTQDSLSQVVSANLRENDIIVNEMCSFMFEMPNIRYAKGCQSVGQPFYGSIGYALPATLGASLAVKDYKKPGRVILFQGDGSAQMTLQEFASYIRFGIDPVIVMLNNSGYSVERVIKGPTRSYNDILVDWDWCSILSVFGDRDGSRSTSHKVEKLGELKKLLMKRLDYNDGKIKMIEVILDRMDVPFGFKKLVGVS